MAVKVIKPNGEKFIHPAGRDFLLKDGHLIVIGAYDAGLGSCPNIAIWAPARWREAVVEEG